MSGRRRVGGSDEPSMGGVVVYPRGLGAGREEVMIVKVMMEGK